MVFKMLISFWKSNFAKLLAVLPPATLFILNIFIVGPTAIYSGNVSEFDVSLAAILQCYVYPGMLTLVISVAIGLLISRRYLSLYVAILLTLGILIWIQGSFFVQDYGPLGKGDSGLNHKVWFGVSNGILWALLLIGAVIFHKKIYIVSSFTCFMLILMQLSYTFYIVTQNLEIWNRQQAISLPKEVFKFSSQQNVVHIILDELQSTVFQEIMEINPGHYDAALEGFTFFKETSGSFPTTKMSIPALLSGQVYKNDMPFHDFLERKVKGNTIMDALDDNGFKIEYISSLVPEGFMSKTSFKWCRIPIPYEHRSELEAVERAAYMLDLVWFRHTPYYLKMANRFNWLPSAFLLAHYKNLPKSMLSGKGGDQHDRLRHLSHKNFLKDLTLNMSVDERAPVYKFVHLMTTHYPAVTNANCQSTGEVLPWIWDNIKIQARCNVVPVMDFLQQLKNIGIYDKSIIIIQADHGYWHIPESQKQVKVKSWDASGERIFREEEYFSEVVSSSLPLLAIKPLGSKGPLKISPVHAQLIDVPVTISALLDLNKKFPGRSVYDLKPDEIREREFHYYDELDRKRDNYFVRMDEYRIRGSAFDRNSWHYIGSSFDRGKYQVTKIVFGSYESSRFLRSGWSANETGVADGTKFCWALGREASVFLSLPRNKTINLSAQVKTPPFDKKQEVTVKVDGKVMGKWQFSAPWQWEKHTVILPPDRYRPDVSIVEFSFSQQWVPDQTEKRPLAVLFDEISLSDGH